MNRYPAELDHDVCERFQKTALKVRYPRTPYWPGSPTIGRGDVVHANPDRFVGEDVVATEKLDGGNTLLHAGRVYARSVAETLHTFALRNRDGLFAAFEELEAYARQREIRSCRSCSGGVFVRLRRSARS